MIWLQIDQTRPVSTGFAPNSANTDQLRPRFGRNWSEVGQNRDELDRGRHEVGTLCAEFSRSGADERATRSRHGLRSSAARARGRGGVNTSLPQEIDLGPPVDTNMSQRLGKRKHIHTFWLELSVRASSSFPPQESSYSTPSHSHPPTPPPPPTGGRTGEGAGGRSACSGPLLDKGAAENRCARQTAWHRCSPLGPSGWPRTGLRRGSAGVRHKAGRRMDRRQAGGVCRRRRDATHDGSSEHLGSQRASWVAQTPRDFLCARLTGQLDECGVPPPLIPCSVSQRNRRRKPPPLPT